MRRAILAIICISLTPVLRAQESPVEGRIFDLVSKRPLAFVNIVYKENGQGTVTNIDGEFRIRSVEQVEFLKFSYLGYETVHIQKDELEAGKKLRIRMIPLAYDIEEVQILPGLNPAHRLIHLCLENRDNNNPVKMGSFSYTSYSKMYFTMDLDSMYVDDPYTTGIGDSTNVKESGGEDDDLEEFLEKNHLFLMEFVSEREFMHPDHNREVVTASRVSGFQDPSFTLLASQLQSFSFYDDLFMIWDRKYLNPVSRGSTRKYLFVLEDTMFTETMDSLFLISFRPLKGKKFDGLKGMLYINSNGYAIQNVIAEAAETEGIFRVRIQQQYEYIEDKQWFPVQLNTDVILSPGEAVSDREQLSLVGVGKSYLKNIKLNPELRRRDFNHVEIQVEPDAHRKNDSYWEDYRVSPLTAKDTNTYRFIDSVGEGANLDRTLKVFETFVSGYIPAGFLNIDYQSLIHWNQFEGFRPGIVAETNDRISRWVQIGGKFAYGTRDKEFKYGGHLRLNMNQRKDAFLKVGYNKDVLETAGWEFIDRPPITSSEIFRSFLIARKDNVEEKFLELQFPVRYLKLNTYLVQGSRQVTDDYRYLSDSPEGPVEKDLFNITETGFRIKYAYKEKFLETPRGNWISLGTKYPVIFANLHWGLPMMGGEYEYLKLEGKISKTFISKSFGDTKLAIAGGWTDRSLPYPLLYSGPGSYGKFTIETENSFATMRLNEFVSDRFISLHFQQDFGKPLFKKGKFQPGIVLAANAGYGAMQHGGQHVNLDQGAYEKGYYESGILFNNLLRQLFLGYGLGVFYRFGPYTLPETIDNFAFKFTIRFNL